MSKYNRSMDNDFGHHSILYKDDDINYSKLRVKRATPSMGTCGLHDSVRDWMNKIQKSVESANENFRSIKIDLSSEEVQKPWLKYAPRNKRASSPQKDARS
uniref:Uncharacterized protein n=1 Tax=Romanomermis culicivorax TaxID=13658 RepID=A0A915L8F1_ROMCU